MSGCLLLPCRLSILKEQFTGKLILCHYLLTFMSFQTRMLLLFPWNLYTADFQTTLERAKNIRTPLKLHERAVQKQLGFFTYDFTSIFSVYVYFNRTGCWNASKLALLIYWLRGKVHPKMKVMWWFTHVNYIVLFQIFQKHSPIQILNLNSFQLLESNQTQLSPHERDYVSVCQPMSETVGLMH